MVKWVDALIVGLALLFVAAFLAFGAEPLVVPEDAVLLHSESLVCGGVVLYHDSNKDPLDGAEYISVVKSGDDVPVAVIQFEDGGRGAFVRAVVLGEELDYPSLAKKYPHPCDILVKAPSRT